MSPGSRITRAGRARPQGGGFELAVWYLIRLTGLGLFVLALAHFVITHVVFNSAIQTAEWVAAERWSSIAWRTLDWLMLSMVLFHAFMGVRVVLQDYTSGGAEDRPHDGPLPGGPRPVRDGDDGRGHPAVPGHVGRA